MFLKDYLQLESFNNLGVRTEPILPQPPVTKIFIIKLYVFIPKTILKKLIKF